jgi:hypothetical protein
LIKTSRKICFIGIYQFNYSTDQQTGVTTLTKNKGNLEDI